MTGQVSEDRPIPAIPSESVEEMIRRLLPTPATPVKAVPTYADRDIIV